MEGKKYRLMIQLNDGSRHSVEFVAPKGEKGKSAYEYAVEGGFTGTEEAFASILAYASFANGPAVRVAEVYLSAAGWKGATSPYSQVVHIPGVTEHSQVDLTPTAEQLSVFHNKDLGFVAENEGGVVTVYAIGQKPQNDYTFQVTITEVTA